MILDETSVPIAEALAALLPGTGLHAGLWLRPAQLDLGSPLNKS